MMPIPRLVILLAVLPLGPLHPRAAALAAKDPAPGMAETDCTREIGLPNGETGQLHDLRVLLQLERIAGTYEARAAQGLPQSDPACFRRLVDQTTGLGMAWSSKVEAIGELYPLARELLKLRLEIAPRDPGNDLVAFRLGRTIAELAKDLGRDSPEDWREAARAFRLAVALDKGDASTKVAWGMKEASLGPMAARNEAVCLLHAANPFEPPNHDQAVALSTANALLKSDALPKLRAQTGFDEIAFFSERQALLEALALPMDRQLPKLIDLATDPSISKEMRQVATEVVGRRLDAATPAVASRELDRLLAGLARGNGGSRGPSAACLRGRVRNRSTAFQGKCLGPHPETMIVNWIAAGSSL